jgi:hypothetical protein
VSALADRLAQPDVADLPDWQAADVLNTRDAAHGTAWRDVRSESVRAVLMAAYDWPKVMEAAGGTPSLLRTTCIIIRDVLTLHETCAFSVEPLCISMQQGLLLAVTEEVVSQAAYDQIMALAQRPMSWAEANNIEVTARTVGLARGGR